MKRSGERLGDKKKPEHAHRRDAKPVVIDLTGDSDDEPVAPRRPIPTGWVPVTRDNMRVPLSILRDHGKGVIASVFSPIFLMPELDIYMIEHQYYKIFGYFGVKNVILKINAASLANNLENAEINAYKRTNQAYIITDLGEDIINRRCIDKKLFWYPAKKQVVVDAIMNGKAMMYGEVLYGARL